MRDAESKSQPSGVEPSADPNVHVICGIHLVTLPIRGLSIRQARALARRLIPVDDACLAVVNGRIVDEEAIITYQVSYVTFVKPSGVLGAT
jgi:hypothetical protein